MIRYVLNTLGSFRSALAVGVGLPFLVASAYAQAPTPAPTEATTERVIVTGSYIPTAETESALPVTVYTAEVLRKQGANTPVEGIRQLPSFVGNAATENDSNGGDGTATINLRALGSANVLILINGRRAFEYADINLIPIGGLARTEILKDGASAVYGSDAVAGVVNFVMLNGPGEKPYEGAELFALYGNTTENDAHVRQVYLRGGVTGLDGKVSIAASGEYYSRANLFSRDRFLVAGTGDNSNNPTGAGRGGLNGNSPTFGGRITVGRLELLAPGAASTSTPTIGALVLQNLSNNAPVGMPPGTTRQPTILTPGFTAGSYRDFENLPGESGHDPSRFNFRAYTPAIPAMERAMYYVTGRYKIFGDGMQLYGDIMYSKSKQDNGLAGAPFTFSSAANGDQAAIRGSVFNPVGIDPNTGANALTSLSYRLVNELGLRRSFFDHDAYRYVVGLNGDFNIKDNGFISRFGYDTGFVYERFDELKIDSGDATRTKLRNEIIAGNFDPFIGVAAPVTGTAPTFVNGVQTGTRAYDNRAAALRSSYIGHSEFYERDYLYDAKINAHLFPNLWDGGWDFAAGYEHRNVAQHSVPDPVQAAGDQLGFNQAPNTKTLQEVDSFFTELSIPIITSTMNVPFARSLDLSIAWRYEKFNDRDEYVKRRSSFDNANQNEDFGGTPRVSLRYQPIPDLTLRATWGQSFRSPSPTALFNPVAQNFPQVFDPLKGATLQPPRGVWQGGNVNLLPEKTDAYSAGLVYTPKWLPGFTMTMDWYQVFTKDLILGAADFAQLALTINGLSGGTALVDPDGCGGGSGAIVATGGTGVGVTRDPATGNVDCIDSLNSNAGKRLVQGMDMTAVYEIPTERWGKFTFSGGYNHFFTWKAEPVVGAGTFSFLGNYNNGTVPLAPGAIPWNKAFVRGEWEWRHFDFVATGNYIGDFRDDPNFDGIVRDHPRNVPSYITLDMQLSYEWVKPPAEPAPYVKESKDSKSVAQTEAAVASIWQRMLWGTRLTVGVNNAFDRYPPSVIGAFNDNYDTSLYSIRNRYWYVSLNKKF
ncbi:MAG: iron complex outerrane recepter protein [Verrucomicrobiota bacterium]|jgi:iron complex outermembrane receptor protein